MAETLTVRVATAGDLAAVDALLARAYPRLLAPAYPPSLIVLAVPRLARAQPRLLASGRYFVVEAEGAVVGAGGWSHAGPAAGAVRHVVTDDRRQRQGIGRALMTAVLRQARAAGVRRMECLATRNAVPFYAALGFDRFGEVAIPLAPGIAFPAERMGRAL